MDSILHDEQRHVTARICRRTRLEDLADLLIGDLTADIAAAGSDPVGGFFYQPEVIAPNKSMRRYLTMRFARTRGIAAGIRFPSLMSLFPSERIDANSIGWRVYRILQSAPERFPVLNEWIGGNAKRRYDLANELGRLFHQYMLYRPDWLNAWERNGVPDELRGVEGASWQGELWRLAAGNDWRGRHFAAKYASLRQGRPDRKRRTIRIFGFSQLAPAVMECLAALSKCEADGAPETDVTLYQLVPSLRKIFDERNRTVKDEIKELVHLYYRTGEDPDRLKDLMAGLFFQHNPLTASFGMQSRVALTVADDLTFQGTDDQEDWDEPDDPGGDTVLHRMQAAILADEPQSETPAPPLDDDGKQACPSVQIRSCYSAFREVEAAHNFILHCLDESPGLTLNDIFIMTPSGATETFAPLVDAVFNHASDTGRLSVTIADRPQAEELPSYRTFLNILSLYKGDFTASDIFTILQDAAVQERIGVTADDCRTFRESAMRAGVRWGWDAEDHRRADTGGSGFPQNTWRAGIDRMLLHSALDIDPAAPFDAGPETLYAVPGYRGGASVTLGRIAYLIGQLHDFAMKMRDLPPSGMAFRQWWELLTQAASDFFGADSELSLLLLRILRNWGEVLNNAREEAALSAPGGSDADDDAASPVWDADDTPLTGEIVLSYLRNRIEESGDSTRGFMRGSITFCGLRPMRSIPAAVIVLLGMNHEAFPGDDTPSEFDLMRRSRKPGDPDKRMEARQLFQDVIMSARNYLYISYVGRNIHDRKESPPSVCVDVLRSYLTREFGKNSFVDIQEPIQAFSPELFEPWPADAPHRKFNQSYSRKLLEAARTLRFRQARPLRPVFALNAVATPPEDSLLRVTSDDLAGFFRNPAKYFMRKRLDASVSILDEAVPEDAEMFEGKLDYTRKQELYDLYLRVRPGTTEEKAELARISLERMKADGAVPLTQTVDDWNEWLAVSALGDAVAAVGAGAERAMIPQTEHIFPCGVTLILPETEVFGTDGGRVQIIPCLAKEVAGNQLVSATLRHLCANLREATVTRIVAINASNHTAVFHEAPGMDPDEAADKLDAILALYRDGLSRPLPFFPKTLCALARGKDYRGHWTGSPNSEGEVEKFGLFFGEELPPVETLEPIANTVFCVEFQDRSRRTRTGRGGTGAGRSAAG